MAATPTTATSRFWHPFADMGAVSQRELLIERGEGVWVYDADDRRYLDGTASLWYANIGHGNREVADARRRADAPPGGLLDLRRLRQPAGERARASASPSHAPMDGARIFLASGGGDAIDAAAKIARRHWIQQGQPERVHLISRTQGYHGTHGFGTSIGGIEANTSNWGPLVPAVSSVAFDSLPALEAEIERVGPEHVAAFFCEPVIGAGGVYAAAGGLHRGRRGPVRRARDPVRVDSVICGFGRLGTWYGIERWEDVRPDMITFAKGVTSGYLPLGGVVVSDAVAGPFFESPAARCSATAPPTPATRPAAPRRMAVLDIYERDGLIERGARARGRARRRAGAARVAPRGRPRCAPGSACSPPSSSRPRCSSTTPARSPRSPQGAREAGVLVRPLLGAIAMLAAADRRAGAPRPAGRGDRRAGWTRSGAHRGARPGGGADRCGPAVRCTPLAVLGPALVGAISGIYKGQQRRCPGGDADVDFHAPRAAPADTASGASRRARSRRRSRRRARPRARRRRDLRHVLRRGAGSGACSSARATSPRIALTKWLMTLRVPSCSVKPRTVTTVAARGVHAAA